MQHAISADELTAMFRGDLPSFFVATVLCTIGLAVALFSPRGARRNLIPAGLFAFLYGARMLVRTGSTAHLLGHPPALPYIAAALEYLVPIPASIAFARFLGRWRRLNDVITVIFSLAAAIAIPYEIIVRRPHAANNVVNAIIVLLISVFLLNYITQPRLFHNVVTFGTLIFTLFVLNEHFGPWRGIEPFGFLIFIAALLYDLLRQSARAQWRLASVESEMTTARRIQESILPRRMPEVADVASVYVPASSVAGDYFDFIDVDEHRFGVVVADVSGHGVGAALVASMLKVAIAMTAAHVRTPARLLAELNAFFIGKLERQFITAVIAFIDTATGELVLSSAGHPPPLVRRANGAVEEVVASGFVLGRMRDAKFVDVRVALGAGDAIVFYTDGVTEAHGYSSERLAACVARGGTSRAIADNIVGELPKENEDDVTMVIVSSRA
ncbi:MAG TPA: PP2C family protein-serine/threonine phosphatase [Thermoanaerobaculia bacterium]|nr:PP2C family protein-serine/threonine phosphatase [Thermoanaerobaculia bacterium]